MVIAAFSKNSVYAVEIFFPNKVFQEQAEEQIGTFFGVKSKDDLYKLPANEINNKVNNDIPNMARALLSMFNNMGEEGEQLLRTYINLDSFMFKFCNCNDDKKINKDCKNFIKKKYKSWYQNNEKFIEKFFKDKYVDAKNKGEDTSDLEKEFKKFKEHAYSFMDEELNDKKILDINSLIVDTNYNI